MTTEAEIKYGPLFKFADGTEVNKFTCDSNHNINVRVGNKEIVISDTTGRSKQGPGVLISIEDLRGSRKNMRITGNIKLHHLDGNATLTHVRRQGSVEFTLYEGIGNRPVSDIRFKHSK